MLGKQFFRNVYQAFFIINKKEYFYENLIQSRMACIKNASFFELLECRFSCGKAALFMKIKYEFADGDVEVDVPMNGRVFWWNWTDWRGIMIRRKDAGTIHLIRVYMKELFMHRRTKSYGNF